MQFKHPEILYFLFFLVVPILVHLFQLRRFKKEYFTNVRFLKALSIQTRKSSKIKKWLLLATRMLLLSCLILAFAQPFFKAKDSNNASNEMYIILDNSFSMQAKGQKGELLKRAVEDLLEHVPENQTFSLITNSETFWNTDIKSIQKELQNLKYSALPFQAEQLISKVKSHKSPFNKDIVVITDAVGLKQNQFKGLEKESNTYFIVPKAEQKKNIAIDSVYINQVLDNFYEIGVKLSTYNNEKSETPIALYNQNKLIAKTIISLEDKEKTVKFTIPKENFNGYVSIIDNGLDYDNTLYFNISKPEKIKVLSIGDPEKSIFLSKIYTKDEFVYNNYPLSALDYNSLEQQDAIVLNELKDIPQALQTTLKNFAEKGGNLVIIPSNESNVADLNKFFSIFGNFQFLNLDKTEKLITTISFNHPLYKGVFEKKIQNFQYPNVQSSFLAKTSNSAVLRFHDQNSFLTSIPNSLSSVYIFSAPINKTNSNFQNSPLIVPTFYNMAQNIQKTGVNSLIIGENQPFWVDASISKDEIVTVKNNTEKFIPIQKILSSKVKLTFNDYPQQAGNFGIYEKDKLLKNISFNYNRTESNLESNKEILSDFKVINNIETVFDTIQTTRTDSEIWKWFVILTLLFLVTEVFIQKFVK
ncbi:MAG: BatA domain-containing protein [Flavobacterium sp.]